ncbi:MAG: polysaccharide deacetylase family protein [Kiritimatiellia bacterium]
MIWLVGWLVFVVLPLGLLAWLVWLACLEYRSDRIPILLYHRLLSKEAADRGEFQDDEPVYVCYDIRFREQMNYLAENGYSTLNLDEYMDIREGRTPLPAKPVVITFDDGYVSNYTMAYPELRRHGFKATIFMVLEPNEYSLHCIDGVDAFMRPDQIRELVAGGIAIQSHTLTHCVLSELGEAEARRELIESRQRLAAITGQPVDHIAIPRAGYNRRVRQWVREAGYRTACCNNKGTACGLSDPLALPRIVIERDMDLKDFRRCLRPSGALALRVVGNLKRIPEQVGGASFARWVRQAWLGNKNLQPLFQTRNLKRIIMTIGVLWLTGAVFFLQSVLFR